MSSRAVRLSDVAIRERVEREVDERIAEFRAAEAAGRDVRLLAILGCGVYGSASDPREDQVRAGIEHWRAERERQRAVQAQIAALEERQKP